MNNKLQNSLNKCLNKVACNNKSTAEWDGGYNPHDCQCAWNKWGRGGEWESWGRCEAISPRNDPIFLDPQGQPCENPGGEGDSCCRRVYTRFEPVCPANADVNPYKPCANTEGLTVNCPGCQGAEGCKLTYRCITYYRRKACRRIPNNPLPFPDNLALKYLDIEVKFNKTIKGRCCPPGSANDPDAPSVCQGFNPYGPPPPPAPWPGGPEGHPPSPGGGGVSG
jgi:hypothetical protein